MSGLLNVLVTAVWPTGLSKTTTSAQTTRINEAEAKLKDSSYHSEKRRWNFEQYVHMHQDQHTILQSLVQHGYAGIDERSKVRHLLDGIKTNELDTAKGQIWASPALQTNFDDCATLFQDFINNKKTATTRTSTIASIGTKRKSDDIEQDDTEPDLSVDDRYYMGQEYAKLSKAKKLGLKLKCQRRGHKLSNMGNNKPGNPGNKGQPRAAPKPTNNKRATMRIIKALSRLLTKGEHEDDDTMSETNPDTGTNNSSNWSNKALQRRK